MTVFEQVKDVLKRAYEKPYVCSEVKGGDMGYIKIEGFTVFGDIAFSLANFPEAPPSGFCIKNTSLSSKEEEGQEKSFTVHVSGNNNRCPDSVDEWVYVSFTVNGDDWANRDVHGRVIFYLDSIREKLRCIRKVV